MVSTRDDKRKREHSPLSGGGLRRVDEKGGEAGVADVSPPGEPVMSLRCVMPEYAACEALTRGRCAENGYARSQVCMLHIHSHTQADGLTHTLHAPYSYCV